MKDKSGEATQVQRDSLYKLLGDYINDVTPLMQTNLLIYEELTLMTHNKRKGIYEALLNLNVFVSFIGIELAAVARASFRAEKNAEKRFNLRYINCVIVEAYKYLYGFESGKKVSLWNKKIQPLLSSIDREDFRSEFCALKQQIIDFGQTEFLDKDRRDLSFHYDLDPIRVYHLLMSINEEEEFHRLCEFLPLLKHILLFSNKYMNQYQVDIMPIDNLKYTFSHVDFDLFSNSHTDLQNEFGEAIITHERLLDRFVHHQTLPAKIEKAFGTDNLSNDSVYVLVDLEKAVMQGSFLYIDLASALRAFQTASSSIEKQLALKQVNTIIYEGFNKLYGLHQKSNESFWQQFIEPFVLRTSDSGITKEYHLLDGKLNELRTVIAKSSNQRHRSTHYRDGILIVYRNLFDLIPTVELLKTSKLLTVLPKITNFLVKCLNVINKKNQEERDEFDLKWRKKFQGIAEVLRKTSTDPKMEDFIKSLEEFSVKQFFGIRPTKYIFHD